KSAFPNGAPPPAADKDKAAEKAPEKAAPKAPDNKAVDKADKKAAAPAAKAADAKAPDAKAGDTKAADAKAPPAAPGRPYVASGKINVVVVADTDFLQDQFWL